MKKDFASVHATLLDTSIFQDDCFSELVRGRLAFFLNLQTYPIL